MKRRPFLQALLASPVLAQAQPALHQRIHQPPQGFRYRRVLGLELNSERFESRTHGARAHVLACQGALDVVHHGNEKLACLHIER